MQAKQTAQTGSRAVATDGLHWCAPAFLMGTMLFASVAAGSAQTPAALAGTPSSATAPLRPGHARRQAKPAPAVSLPQQTAVPPAPVVPPPPNWPANGKPVDASVVWDSHGLSITAANSSLLQILDQISTETGAKVQGMNADQRVFGSYGPGSARDVIAQLLDGSGYNVLMIGDQGAGTPRQIVLSARPSGPAPVYRPSPAEEDFTETEPPPPPPQPEPAPIMPNAGAAQPPVPGGMQSQQRLFPTFQQPSNPEQMQQQQQTQPQNNNP